MPDLYLSESKPFGEEGAWPELLSSYIKNEVKLKKTQRKDLSLFNSQETLNNNFVIRFPGPDEWESEADRQRCLRQIQELERIVRRGPKLGPKELADRRLSADNQ